VIGLALGLQHGRGGKLAAFVPGIGVVGAAFGDVRKVLDRGRIGIGALAIGGKGLNFGIDFKSGTRIQTAFVTPVTENQTYLAKYANAIRDIGFEAEPFARKYSVALRITPDRLRGF